MVLTKTDVELDIKGKGEFVQIDHLKRFLLRADSTEVKKFILLKLAALHELHNFFVDAARNLEAAAEITLADGEKKEIYVKEIEVLMKAEQFDLADRVLIKALSCSTSKEKGEVHGRYLEFYKSLGKKLESDGKQRKALYVYKKLYSLNNLPVNCKIETKQRMKDIYMKTGNVAEFHRIEKMV